jgi:hypothetical protein
MFNEIKEAALKQGTSITELSMKINDTKSKNHKTIAEQLEEDAKEIKQIASTHIGQKTYMLNVNTGGAPTLIPIKNLSEFSLKDAGPMATVDGVGIAGNTASITQAFDAATLLRLAMGAPVYNQYRNSQWLFELINLINGAYDATTSFARWFDEVPMEGEQLQFRKDNQNQSPNINIKSSPIHIRKRLHT